MIKREETAVLIIASRLLSYPDETFPAYESAMDELTAEEVQSKDLKQQLKKSYRALFQLSRQERSETYVATFDLKSKLGLYLTAHELGDSSKRGAALIKLQKMINQAGFEREGDELADYIPMLLEFLAIAPLTKDHERLSRRLAVAVQRMLNHIEDTNPYQAILYVLMRFVFPVPTKEEVEKLEFDREEADLEELPFPIMYQ
ncbi:nitrate reductase molybdenum cofactor assembly chaperone [Oceanobacillus sp. FSL H7-0719]|uniref:nitrate reductase molybdenum cofactor assembly chaperone n=1 Tax=Oceanobacillus sp. FSL H7-0719 TaxID=2954507 RepID=UPI003254A7DD